MRHLGQFWTWLRVVVTALAVGVTAAGIGGAVAPVASALPIYGGEVVIIDSVTISGNAYAGICDSGLRLAIPVTVTATFIPPLGSKPVGPYAVVNSSAGYGSADNHFGTPQGHGLSQVFHLFIYPGSYSGGTGTATVTVQDVGVAGGYAERDDIPVQGAT